MSRRARSKKASQDNKSCISSIFQAPKNSVLTAADLPVDKSYASHVAKALVDRKGLDSDRSLMVSEAYLKPLSPGINKPLCDRPQDYHCSQFPYPPVGLVDIPTLTLHAHWYTADEKPAKTDKDANVFGSSGTLELTGDNVKRICIPVVNAKLLDQNVCKFFKVQLLKTQSDPVVLDTGHFETLYMVKYRFHTEYVQQYVMEKKRGGGLFVETHDFPHVFTPLSSQCSGGLIIGKKVDEHHYMLVGLKIPYGYTLKIDANVIHGDSFFKGPFGIALTEDLPADTVIMRNQENEIVQVSQYDLTKSSHLCSAYRKYRERSALQRVLGLESSLNLFKPVSRNHHAKSKYAGNHLQKRALDKHHSFRCR